MQHAQSQTAWRGHCKDTSEDGNRELPHSWLRIMSLGTYKVHLKNLPIFPIPGAF